VRPLRATTTHDVAFSTWRKTQSTSSATILLSGGIQMFPALDSILNSGKKNPGRFLRSGLTTRGLDFYAERSPRALRAKASP
jgi:hypothetical protein